MVYWCWGRCIFLCVQINDRYEFPLQLDLDRENGKYLSPESDKSVRNLYTLHRYLLFLYCCMIYATSSTYLISVQVNLVVLCVVSSAFQVTTFLSRFKITFTTSKLCKTYSFHASTSVATYDARRWDTLGFARRVFVIKRDTVNETFSPIKT